MDDMASAKDYYQKGEAEFSQKNYLEAQRNFFLSFLAYKYAACDDCMKRAMDSASRYADSVREKLIEEGERPQLASLTSKSEKLKLMNELSTFVIAQSVTDLMGLYALELTK